MLVHQESNFQLGSHAVGTGDQDGLFDSLKLGDKQAAKAAQRTDHAGNIGGFHQRLNAVDRLIAGGNVDTGRGVRI
ncbi:hypothetical protein SDC9_207185 [bioreactor metagenome]|uniref:Uncharacterized protein n=1 Tax=bioreactor metagenome TaxID=1076179 RepID=A0A645JGI4_9ZZZZ